MLLSQDLMVACYSQVKVLLACQKVDRGAQVHEERTEELLSTVSLHFHCVDRWVRSWSEWAEVVGQAG